MNAVTGIGPRTGTSFVMSYLHEAGLIVNGHKFLPDLVVPEHNPNGYWELDPSEDIPTTGISKLWRLWEYKNINKVVLLERQDVDAQLRSIKKVLDSELLLPKFKNLRNVYTPEKILSTYIIKTNNWLKKRDMSKTMLVYTENINKELNNIKELLMEDN